MAKLHNILVLLCNVLLCVCQEYGIDDSTAQEQDEGHPSYSFGYGVSDIRTGDVKAVWEEKEGDTVKGHYSVIEPDGSMRTVDYSAGPNTGFTAIVNNNGNQNEAQDEQMNNNNNPEYMEDKALRDYDRYYDFSEEADSESSYKTSDRKRKRHPYESLFKDYSFVKRPKYPSDLEPSEYTHSIDIKHPHEDSFDAPAHSHMGYNYDPNCRKKHKPVSNYYGNIADSDFRKQKYPSLTDSRYEHDKYKPEASSIDAEKYVNSYKPDSFKPFRPDEYNEPPPKYGYSSVRDVPRDVPESSYSDYIPPRPKKKYKPHKHPEPFDPENLDDYVLVPKRKLKKPQRVVDDYPPESDEDFDHRAPYSSYDDDFEDDRYQKPPRPTGTQKEVVKKVVKKKPIINILDIFDI
ncbi:unnamed protein product [Colias eurytheme]|nr:unnamed protein product [Colias eurytheme]